MTSQPAKQTYQEELSRISHFLEPGADFQPGNSYKRIKYFKKERKRIIIIIKDLPSVLRRSGQNKNKKIKRTLHGRRRPEAKKVTAVETIKKQQLLPNEYASHFKILVVKVINKKILL